MKKGSPIRFWAVGLLLCAAAGGPATPRSAAQTDQTVTAQLLGKAHALEVRGRIDMAKQQWQQVLLVDPNNSEALAGMARAAKLEGHEKDAQAYLEKLRKLNPSDPNIARVEGMSTQQNTSAQLQQAGRLAQAGQYARAMAILRQVYGDTPPPGDGALSYYQTEAATEEGRPHAIAGLRSLVDKYPQDSRYQIALGRILTYNPRTREEGRKLLERHPTNPEAVEALRQSLVWDAQNPATSADIRSYLSRHKDQQLSAALAQTDAQAAAARQASRAAAGPRPVPLTGEQRAAQEAFRARTAADNAAYASLNAHRIEDAEAKFKAILATTPQDAQALAGLGYVRMQQSNFGGAISFLEQAQNDGSKDPAVEKALRDSRFYYTMQEATAALNQNDLVTAQRQFQSALSQRPNDPEALLGLGGTLLKAQQAEPAAGVYATYARVKPGDQAAWRGLFMAQYGAGKFNDALSTDKRVPPAVKAQLLRDPDYLRTMASVYLALGRDADAQRVLRSALELPFPVNARGVKADVQLQYAALLAAAGRRDQAAGLYRQVLAGDSTNTNAWAGLVQTQHAMGDDAAALATLQAMPPQNYGAAMQEAGFETTVAAIYQSQGKYDLAQDVLEKFLAKQRQEGKKPFVPAAIQLAGLYLQHGDSQQAYAVYRDILANNPDRPDAWRGLLTALHGTNHDQEALAQVQQIPAAVRRELENDPVYLQTVGSIYAGLGQPQEAMVFFNRVQQHYAAQHIAPPADIDIQNAWLLYNGRSDAALYRSLMALGARADLTNEQRRTVQQIWASWAVRRANQASAAGNTRKSLAILNAAAAAFPDNPAVTRALASGYAQAGMTKQAVALFKSQDLSTAPAGDYKAAVGAALADNDVKDAETWLRFGLDQYPRDPQMLLLAARFEKARGDSNRAAEYYRASLANMPKTSPGTDLATELSRPSPVTPARSLGPVQNQDLATLLSTPDNSGLPAAQQQPQETRPYLPGSPANVGGAPVTFGAPGAGSGAGSSLPYTGTTGSYDLPGSGTPMYGGGVTYSSPAVDGATGITAAPAGSTRRRGSSRRGSTGVSGGQGSTTLKDYVPQAELGDRPVLHLRPNPAFERAYGPYVPYDPSVETPKMALADALRARNAGLAQVAVVGSAAQGEDLPVVAYAPVSQGSVELRAVSFQQSTTADGTPIVPYAATAKPAHNRTPGPAARRRAAAIRANQDTAPEAMTGVSRPPSDNYSVQIDNAQYNAAQQQGAQVQQPTQRQVREQSSQTPTTYQQGTPAPVGGQGSNGQAGDSGYSYGQQYPQPTARGTESAGTSAARRPRATATRRRTTRTESDTVQSMHQEAPVQQQPLQYPQYGQPLTNPGPPQAAQPYPLPPPPTDQQLIERNVPPLRTYYDPRIDTRTPLTERQDAELQLLNLEGAYSNWVGGTVNARYRSGTPGIDRLSALEVPFEVSFTLGRSVRFTVVPTAVFLNSGVLDTTGGALGTNPVLGSLPGNATFAPQQQFASGIGGEVQLTANTFAVALGTTPYQFLVSNVIGRARWKPGNGHFTLYGGRDAVKQTQLSYAGLRDPGSATTTFGGNVWGGVVETGAGVRFDSGNEKAGLYLQFHGSSLTGYHVLDNKSFDGTMGAYFRVKSWPEYGSLNVGGTVFGEHYAHNERGQTYGLGGYFSPEAYFLAAIPVTFQGHHGTDVHYTINGSVGVQTFQEDSQIFFPLDTALQTAFTSGCTTVTNPTCGRAPVNSNTGLNYAIDAQGSYRVNEHWYVGGFLSGNNTNNYNTISGGFFARYLFKPQYPTADYPTGLFPVEGVRPLQVP